MHTAKYLGPKGSVAQISNGMNCQNCHLDAGTKIFGNNYGSVASTFPKFRARSGSEENVYKRVNDCFERSLNGLALDTTSAEMQAIKAYMLFLGKNVEKGTTVKGSGLKDVPFLDRAADPFRGKTIYVAKCASCHQDNGEGLLNASKEEYTYPPLWGKNSYNDAAGLYRLSNFAKYVKYNMPLAATHEMPQLSDMTKSILENMTLDVELQADGDLKASGSVLNIGLNDKTWKVVGDDFILTDVTKNEDQVLKISERNESGFTLTKDEVIIKLAKK